MKHKFCIPPGGEVDYEDRLYSKLLQRNPETWYQFPVSAVTPSDTYEAIINPHFARYF